MKFRKIAPHTGWFQIEKPALHHRRGRGRLSFFIIIAMLSFTCGLFAQRQVRKDTKKGNKSYQEKLYNAAEASYNKALEENPMSPEALFNLGNTYYRQGNVDKAIESYGKYVQAEKEDDAKMSTAWHNIANSLLRKKDLQKSMEAYKNALRLNPLDDEARYNLAVVQKMMQDDKQDNKQNQQPQDKQDQKQDPKQDPQQKPDKPEDKQEQQMSPENMEQLLKAIEQQEKETQDKVQRMKNEERKKQNERNRRQNKDW